MLREVSRKSPTVNNTVELRKQAGAWLRLKRCDLGLSQRELAERVDMEYYTFISQIEAGRGRIPADKLQKWSEALEMDPKEFAINIMRYYDPCIYDMIFGEKV